MQYDTSHKKTQQTNNQTNKKPHKNCYYLMQSLLFIHFYSEQQIVTLKGLYLSNFLLLRILLRADLPEYYLTNCQDEIGKILNSTQYCSYMSSCMDCL